MTREGWGGLGVALALASCATAPAPMPNVPRIACPAVLTAQTPVEPVQPALSPEQRLALDVATVRAVGAPLAGLLALGRVQADAWGRTGWSRVDAGRSWCATIDSTSATVSDKTG